MAYNPFEAGHAQLAEPPAPQPSEDYDPFKAGDATPTPAENAEPSNDELYKQFETDYSKTTWQRAKELPGHVLEGIKGIAKPIFVDAPKELGEASTQPGFGRRALSTWTNAKARTVQELSDFVAGIPMHQIEKFVDHPGDAALDLLTGPVPMNYLRGESPAQQKARAWKEYQLKHFRKQAEAKQQEAAPSALTKFITTVIEPFSNVAEQVVGPAEALPNTERALATIGQVALPEAALGIAGKVGKVADAALQGAKLEKGAVTAAKGVQGVGKAAETVGHLPETITEAATKALLGPEAAAKAEQAANVTSLASVPAALASTALQPVVGPLAGLKVLEKAGQVTKGVGEVVEALASAPKNSIWGRMHAVATSADSPNWMKTFLSVRGVKGVAEAGRAGLDVAKGAATAGGIGALYGAGMDQSAEEMAESVGGGMAFGAGVHAAKIPGLNNRKILARAAAASADLLHQHISEGADPAALKNVSDSAWTMAAALQQYPGLNAKIRFASPEQFAALKTADGSPLTDPGAGGVWDRSNRTVWINTEAKRGVETTLLHEAAHPIFDAAVLRQPEVARPVMEALAQRGLTIDNLKRQYIETLMTKELASMPDHQTREAAINSRIEAYDAAFPNDSWIYSEVLAENFVNSFDSKNILNLDPTTADVFRDVLKSFGGKENAKGFFKEFDNVVQSPALTKLSRGLLHSMREHRPGLDTLGGEAKGVKLTPEMFGQRPEAPLHKLANGEIGNDFVIASPDGIKVRPPSVVRRMLKDRVAAVRGLFNSKNVKPLGDTSPEVSYRRTRAGGEEISGKTLPASFFGLTVFSEDTKNIARSLQKAIDSGETMGSWYHQIGTGKGNSTWKQSVQQKLGALVAEFHDYQPVGWTVTKAGHLTLQVFDRNALNAKLADWAGRKGIASLEQWGGDQGKAMADIRTYLDNHSKGLKGEDNGIGTDKSNVINAILAGDNAEFREKNPLRQHMKGKDRQGIVRSLRLDRIETLEPSNQKPIPRPEYNKLVHNFSPMEDAATLAKSSPEEFKKIIEYRGPYGGGLTGWAFELGSRITNDAELSQLIAIQKEMRDNAVKAREAGDIEARMVWSTKAQAFREAFEAATDLTLDGKPSSTQDFINKRLNPDFKTPLPKSAKFDGGYHERSAQLFSPDIPADDVVSDALHAGKKDFVGAHRNLPAGTPVGLRIDIPAFTEHGVYAVTVHEKAKGGTVGKRIGYDGIARVENPTFMSNEKGAAKIKSGEANKFPVATVEGEFNPSREIPADIKSWTPVGYNPKEHSYFYTKTDGTPVTGGKSAISVGNTVFVKDPVFGDKANFQYSPDVDLGESRIDLKKAGFLGSRISSILGAKKEKGLASPGLTFGVAEGKEQKRGFSVSLWPELSRQITPEEFTKQTFSDFIKTNWELLGDKPENAVGVWDDRSGQTGSIWLDLVTNLEDRALAEYAGKKYNQAGIGDLAKFAKGEDGLISTGGDGSVPKGVKLPPPSERLNLLKEEYENPPAAEGPSPISGVPIYEKPEPLPKGSGLFDVAKYFSDRTRKINGGNLSERTPTNRQKIAHALADDAEHAVKQQGNALGWYDSEIKAAMANVAKLHPELEEPARGMFYRALIAITSNGQSVEHQFYRADDLYNMYKKTGKIETDSAWGGSTAPAINAGLARLMTLVEQHGLEKTAEFLTREFTVRELEKQGFLVPGELKDYKVKGSMIFGPKIGAFFSNLNGDFSPVTMDRWFMRTFNRVDGTLTGINLNTLPKHIENFINTMKDDRSTAKVRADGYRMLREIKEGKFDLDKELNSPFLAHAAQILRKYEKDRFVDRSPINKASKNVAENFYLLNESPDSGSHRAWIREVVGETQKLLRKRGINLANADLQAALWYYEKDLYAKHGLKSKRSAPASYRGVSERLLNERGAGNVRLSEPAAEPAGGSQSPEQLSLPATQ